MSILLIAANQFFSSLFSKIYDNDPVKVARRNRQKAIKRQKALEKKEIKQTWNFVYGDIQKVKKKDIHTITDVTLRKIWMENLFLYNTIVSMNPDERFHSSDKYILEWQVMIITIIYFN